MSKSTLKKELKNITHNLFGKEKNTKKTNLLDKLNLSENNVERDNLIDNLIDDFDDDLHMLDEEKEYGYHNEIEYDDYHAAEKLLGGERKVNNRYNTKSFVRSERNRLERLKDDNDDNDNMENLDRQRTLGRDIETYEEVDLENHKYPFVMKISKQKILNNKFDYNIQNDISYAKASLAFHHWIHASHNKTLEFDNFVGKKKVYNVVNGYERRIDDYDKSIDDMIETQFKNTTRSRKFSRIYEILMYFDIASDKDLSGLFIDSNPSNIIQPVMEYRKMYFNGKDKYVGVKSDGEDFNDNEDDNEDTTELKSKDIKFVSTLEKYSSNDKFNFIIGNAGIDWNKNNIQEQSISLDILRTINICLNNLNKNGNLILRMYETFTKLSLKYLMILSELFEDVHILKPLTCRNSDTDKYVVCQKFKGNDKFKKELSSLSKIESESDYSKRRMLEDVFTSVDIPDQFFVNMISFNSLLTNQHYKTINKIMEFIDGLNYHGELYAHYRDRQIELAGYWNSIFLGKKLGDIRNKTKKLLEEGIKDVHSQYVEFSNTLVGYDVGSKFSRNK